LITVTSTPITPHPKKKGKKNSTWHLHREKTAGRAHASTPLPLLEEKKSDLAEGRALGDV